MSAVFAITTAATTLRVDAQGRAECPVTVSNAGARALRGRIDVKAAPPAGAWVSVAGEAEREFAPHGTHQFVVRLAVPPGSAPGKYTFRVDAVSADNPDEDFAEGPTVAFEVTTPAPRKAPFPWWIVAVAVAALLVVGGAVWWMLSKRTTPDQTTGTPPAAVPSTPGAQTPPPAAETRFDVQLGRGWVDYRDMHLEEALPQAGTEAWRVGNVCVVRGLIENSSGAGPGQQVAVLPPQCRPKARLIFNLNMQGTTARVDVVPDGQVVWVAGGTPPWLSLTGIAFAVADGKAPAFGPMWANWNDLHGNDPYQTAVAFKQGNLCFVHGLVLMTGPVPIPQQPLIAVLPDECRPAKRLVFNLNNHTRTARVDVLPNGQVVWVAGGTDGPWISLSGIVFRTGGAGTALTLGTSWSDYGAEYEGATVTNEGGLCEVQGLVKTGDPGGVRSRPHIGTLPDACRPRERLVFNLNNHVNTARVDALADGRLFWQRGGADFGWISLSGLLMVAPTAQ